MWTQLLNHSNNSNKTLCEKAEVRRGNGERETLFSHNCIPLTTLCFAFEPIFSDIPLYVWHRIITYFLTKQIVYR